MNQHLDADTTLNVEHGFAVLMTKMNHLYYFLNVYAEKGQVNFIKSTIKCLKNELYYQIACRLPHPYVEFNLIRQAYEEKIDLMVDLVTEKYLERGIVNFMAML
jgi:hypothetical protein